MKIIHKGKSRYFYADALFKNNLVSVEKREIKQKDIELFSYFQDDTYTYWQDKINKLNKSKWSLFNEQIHKQLKKALSRQKTITKSKIKSIINHAYSFYKNSV